MKASDARIIFAGTPEFAAIHLKALLSAGIKPIAVYTQPDRPAGRGQQLQASPVKELALTYGISVEQPVNFKSEEAKAQLAQYTPDLMIVVAYGLLLPQAVLDMPKLGCINMHGSLLPRWRGAAPIQRAILALDSETGVDLMQMEAGLDTGPVLAETRLSIEPSDTGGTLHDKLAHAGAELLVCSLPALLQGNLTAVPQPDVGALYARKLEKAESDINWHRSATEIDAQVRAFNPWPVAQTSATEHSLRVWRSSPLEVKHAAEPGTVLELKDDAIIVACQDSALAIHEAQLAGGKRLAIKDLLNAKRALFAPGTRLGKAL